MKIGFIGLGIMGKPMSTNLIKAGHDLMVHTPKEHVMDEVVALGAKKGTLAETAAFGDVLITMVPDSPQVRQVALGQGGILENARPGTTLIDMSSIDPNETRAIGAALLEKGIHMLDCPVSGGEPKAIEGTLAVMGGGDPQVFERYRDLLMAMAGSVTYVGPLGSGNVAKLANNIIVAVNIAVASEALMFAQKSGADPERVYQAIRGGLAGSTVLDAKAPMMLSGNFKPGFRIGLHIKDLNNAIKAGHAVQSPLPLTAQVMELMQVLRGAGYDHEDHSALLRYYEKLVDTTLTPREE